MPHHFTRTKTVTESSWCLLLYSEDVSQELSKESRIVW